MTTQMTTKTNHKQAIEREIFSIHGEAIRASDWPRGYSDQGYKDAVHDHDRKLSVLYAMHQALEKAEGRAE